MANRPSGHERRRHATTRPLTLPAASLSDGKTPLGPGDEESIRKRTSEVKGAASALGAKQKRRHRPPNVDSGAHAPIIPIAAAAGILSLLAQATRRELGSKAPCWLSRVPTLSFGGLDGIGSSRILGDPTRPTDG